MLFATTAPDLAIGAMASGGAGGGSEMSPERPRGQAGQGLGHQGRDCGSFKSKMESAEEELQEGRELVWGHRGPWRPALGGT